MPDKVYTLTTPEQDRIVQRVCQLVLGKSANRLSRDPVEPLAQSREIYIAKPVGDEGTAETTEAIPRLIPAEDEDEYDKPGQAECEIYQIIANGDGEPELHATGRTETVYNIEKQSISRKWIQIHRDNFGKWVAIRTISDDRPYKLCACAEDQTGTGTSGESSYVSNNLEDDVGRVVRVDGLCYVVSEIDDEDWQYLKDNCVEPECVVIESRHDNCEDCCGCWDVENCNDSGVTKRITADLVVYFGDEYTPEEIVEAGKIVFFSGQCWVVTAHYACGSNCEGAEEVTVATDYEDCDSCPGYALTPCEEGSEVARYTRRAVGPTGEALDLADYSGKILRLDGGGCYTVSEETGTGSIDWETVGVLESYDSCDDCKVYGLTQCGGSASVTMLTYGDLHGATVGQVVLNSDSECWEVTSDDEPWPESGTGGLEPFDWKATFDNCEECETGRKFKLTNDCFPEECEEDSVAADDIITTMDLFDLVDQYLKIHGTCYKVTQGTEEEVTDEEVDYEGPYPTCQTCIDAPINAVIDPIASMKLEDSKLNIKTRQLVIRGGEVKGICHGLHSLDTTDCEDTGTGTP